MCSIARAVWAAMLRGRCAAQTELISSLDDLQRVHQFQIIFYNEKPKVFNPGGGRIK